jgi:hypothetical protein
LSQQGLGGFHPMTAFYHRRPFLGTARRGGLLLACFGVLLTLAGCIDAECPHEIARPLDRARWCGPSAP